MGCDIHVLVEIYDDAQDEWVTPYNDLKLHYSFEKRGYERNSRAVEDRHYGRFAALAGVRGDGPEAKGLPDDMCSSSRYWFAHCSGDHSESWYPMRDFLQIIYKADCEEFTAYNDGKLPPDFPVWKGTEAFASELYVYYFNPNWHMQEIAIDKMRVLFNFDS